MKKNYETGKSLREACRTGEFTNDTTGYASGYVQANLVVLPSELSKDFLTFCQKNDSALPLLETTLSLRTDACGSGSTTGVKKNYEAKQLAPGSDLRTDLPKYDVWKYGKIIEQGVTDVSNVWTNDLHAFLLGCSAGFEDELIKANLTPRYLANSDDLKIAPMYYTNIPLQKVGIFEGNIVVSMRPYKLEDVKKVVKITSEYVAAHGKPIHIGDPQAIGITNIDVPDYGDKIEIKHDEIPLFWACGVTPITCFSSEKCGKNIPLAITHTPGYMFVADVLNSELKKWKIPDGSDDCEEGTIEDQKQDIVFTLFSKKYRKNIFSQQQLDAAWDVGGHNADYLPDFKKKTSLLSKKEYESADSAPDKMFLNLKYGSRPHEKLDFLPAIANIRSSSLAAPPTFVWIHGGGWQIPSPKEDHAWIASKLRKHGVNVVLLEYSAHSPNNLPISIQCEQVIKAIIWLKNEFENDTHSENSILAGRGDVERIVVGGHSAGGHLAAVSALHPQSRKHIAAVVSVAGVGELSGVKASYLNEEWGDLANTGRGGSGVHLTDSEVESWSPSRMVAKDDGGIRGISTTVGGISTSSDVQLSRVPQLLAVVGEEELPELIRQADEELVQPWLENGHFAELLTIPKCRHFDILAELTNPDGLILTKVLELLKQQVGITHGSSTKAVSVFHSFVVELTEFQRCCGNNAVGVTGGSPAAIVPLYNNNSVVNVSDNTLQRIAKTLGYPATCFVNCGNVLSNHSANNLEGKKPIFNVRFFSTATEYPMCGHGTVAVATWLVNSGRIKLPKSSAKKKNCTPTPREISSEIIIRTPTQSTEVVIRSSSDDDLTAVEIMQSLAVISQFDTLDNKIPGGGEDWSCKSMEAILASIFKIDAEALTKSENNLPIKLAKSEYFNHLIVPVVSLESIQKINPDFEALREFCKKFAPAGTYIHTVVVFCLLEESENTLRCRDFCPLVGTNEAAATGTTNRALSCYLYRYLGWEQLLRRIQSEEVRLSCGKTEILAIKAEQGYEMGKPSLVKSELTISLGANACGNRRDLIGVKVGGMATMVKRGLVYCACDEEENVECHLDNC